MTNETRRTWYLWSVTLLGVAAIILSAYRLAAAKLDARFLLLALVTVFVASRITIRVPRAKGRISVSDTFLFLTFLLFGGQAAVLVAALEAFVSSIHFSKKYLVRTFNASVMAVATFATASVLNWIYGDITLLTKHFSTDLIAALCIMALVQYGLNSSLIAISVALNSGESIWRSWYKNFLWTSITYFAGAFGAGIVARLITEVGTFAFLATTPIITIIYFTYRTYLSNIEASAAQAEQARLHVAELNRQFAEQERISQALEESEAHFRTAFDHAAIGMALVSPEGCWLRVNRSLRDILGYDEEELLATDFQAFTHRDDLGRDLAELYRMLSGEIQSSQLEKRFLHKLGHEVWTSVSASLVRNSHSEPLHFICQVQDITERRRAEAAIQTLSLIDELTGLYNRRGFMTFAAQHLNSVHRTDKGLVILYADLDGLKQINDSLGHKEGDRALIKTAELFKETFRTSDVLGRLGGDEFTVLAAVDPEGGVEGLITRLQQKFTDFNLLRIMPYDLQISIGVAQHCAERSESIEDLLALADKAMYEQKRLRKTGQLQTTAKEPPIGEAAA